jgi:hypothetical protein
VERACGRRGALRRDERFEARCFSVMILSGGSVGVTLSKNSWGSGEAVGVVWKAGGCMFFDITLSRDSSEELLKELMKNFLFPVEDRGRPKAGA